MRTRLLAPVLLSLTIFSVLAIIAVTHPGGMIWNDGNTTPVNLNIRVEHQ